MSYPKKRVNLLFKNREQVDTDLLKSQFELYQQLLYNKTNPMSTHPLLGIMFIGL